MKKLLLGFSTVAALILFGASCSRSPVAQRNAVPSSVPSITVQPNSPAAPARGPSSPLHLTGHFVGATFTMDQNGDLPTSIRFREGNQPTVVSFFDEFKKVFSLSEDNQFKQFKVDADNVGYTHYVFKQYYKEIEVLDAQYALHEKNGFIQSADGHLVYGLNLDVTPVLTEQAALQIAIAHVNGKLEESKLVLTYGRAQMVAQNFKLAYQFQIYPATLIPTLIFVDAKSGAILNTIPLEWG